MYKLPRALMMGSILMLAFCAFVTVSKFAGVGYAVAGLALLGIFANMPRVVRTAFGTARWANAEDLTNAGMLNADSGLILGQLNNPGPKSLPKAILALFSSSADPKRACEEFLSAFGRSELSLVRLPNAVHTMICAPTGVGKGVYFVVTDLLMCPESTVAVDFKGELKRLTAEHRCRVFGHRVVVLDPLKMTTQSPDTFNPLDCIDKNSDTALDECRSMANALVIRTGEEKDPHWADSAELILTALIALVVYYGEPGDRSLQTVRRLLTDPEKFAQAVKLMCKSDAWGGMLARMGGQLLHYKDKELSSTLTTTNRFVCFLDTPAVARSTTESTFTPAELRKGKMTIYLIIPPEHMPAQAPLLRLWIGTLIRTVMHGGLQEKNKVHFVLDEASSLGHMSVIDSAVDMARGYGIKLKFFFQSVGQIKKCFPNGQEQTLLSNVTQVYFGVNDLQTAEQVSNRLGESTIVIDSGGSSSGTSHQTSQQGQWSNTQSFNKNDNWAQHGRKLYKPEEILTLPQRTAITFTPGVPPICTTLVRYYEPPISTMVQAPGEAEDRTNMTVGSLLFFGATAFLAYLVTQRL